MTTITALPTPPSRSDPANFAARGDAFLGALPTFATEANAVASEVNASALAAQISEDNAEGYAAAAQVAATAASASKWNAATSYAEGAVVWSPLNGKAYRRKAPGGVVATDPASDATNWYDVLSLSSPPYITIATNTSAQAGNKYALSATLELLLPAAPAVGDVVSFLVLPGVTGCSINPNGLKIRGATGIMNIDVANAGSDLTYTGTTHGWV